MGASNRYRRQKLAVRKWCSNARSRSWRSKGIWQSGATRIPVASGLIDEKLNKRAAVDLAKIEEDRLDLYELKCESDNPVYAAFEILQYGLAYLLCRVNRKEFGYADLRTMKVNALGLNVLAPHSYYKRLPT